MIGALTAVLRAAAEILKLLPLVWMRAEEKHLEGIEDEIMVLGHRGDSGSKLVLEVLNQRRQRSRESLRALRAALGPDDSGG